MTTAEIWYCARCESQGKRFRTEGTVGEKRYFLNGCPKCHSDDVFQDEPLKCASCEKAFSNESYPGLSQSDRCPNCDRLDLEKKPPRQITWPPAQIQ